MLINGARPRCRRAWRGSCVRRTGECTNRDTAGFRVSSRPHETNSCPEPWMQNTALSGEGRIVGHSPSSVAAACSASRMPHLAMKLKPRLTRESELPASAPVDTAHRSPMIPAAKREGVARLVPATGKCKGCDASGEPPGVSISRLAGCSCQRSYPRRRSPCCCTSRHTTGSRVSNPRPQGLPPHVP